VLKSWYYWKGRKVPIKIALPKGRLLGETAALLRRASWGLSGYTESARLYRLIFHERDIPIQVAVGNYDLGICGLDWVQELLVKYPSSPLVKVKNLGYGEGLLYMVASRSAAATIGEIQAKTDVIRIASEYPNLAESFAADLRLRRFNIFPLWGAAEAYPPENADLALISGKAGAEAFNNDLVPVSKILGFSAFLIANKGSWQTKDMGEVLASIEDNLLAGEGQPASVDVVRAPEKTGQYLSREVAEDSVRLALPDGHQQLPTLQLLKKAGIQIDDYPSSTGNRRLTANLDWLTIKVIRPQDMPLQVANGNFDLAITGRDWFLEHLYQFPSSPITELVDLKLGKVKIVAVVSKDLAVADVDGLRQLNAERSVPFRVASEYVNIADKYARDNHLGMYRVVPTWGATEAFLPEDADLLIENTETGRTIARHNLKIIDTLFTSAACLIGGSAEVFGSTKSGRMKYIVETLRAAGSQISIIKKSADGRRA